MGLQPSTIGLTFGAVFATAYAGAVVYALTQSGGDPLEDTQEDAVAENDSDPSKRTAKARNNRPTTSASSSARVFDGREAGVGELARAVLPATVRYATTEAEDLLLCVGDAERRRLADHVLGSARPKAFTAAVTVAATPPPENAKPLDLLSPKAPWNTVQHKAEPWRPPSSAVRTDGRAVVVLDGSLPSEVLLAAARVCADTAPDLCVVLAGSPAQAVAFPPPAPLRPAYAVDDLVEQIVFFSAARVVLTNRADLGSAAATSGCRCVLVYSTSDSTLLPNLYNPFGAQTRICTPASLKSVRGRTTEFSKTLRSLLEAPKPPTRAPEPVRPDIHGVLRRSVASARWPADVAPLAVGDAAVDSVELNVPGANVLNDLHYVAVPGRFQGKKIRFAACAVATTLHVRPGSDGPVELARYATLALVSDAGRVLNETVTPAVVAPGTGVRLFAAAEQLFLLATPLGEGSLLPHLMRVSFSTASGRAVVTAAERVDTETLAEAWSPHTDPSNRLATLQAVLTPPVYVNKQRSRTAVVPCTNRSLQDPALRLVSSAPRHAVEVDPTDATALAAVLAPSRAVGGNVNRRSVEDAAAAEDLPFAAWRAAGWGTPRRLTAAVPLERFGGDKLVLFSSTVVASPPDDAEPSTLLLETVTVVGAFLLSKTEPFRIVKPPRIPLLIPSSSHRNTAGVTPTSITVNREETRLTVTLLDDGGCATHTILSLDDVERRFGDESA